MKSRKIRMTAQFFNGAKRYFAGAVFASLMTTALNALTPRFFDLPSIRCWEVENTHICCRICGSWR